MSFQQQQQKERQKKNNTVKRKRLFHGVLKCLFNRRKIGKQKTLSKNLWPLNVTQCNVHALHTNMFAFMLQSHRFFNKIRP